MSATRPAAEVIDQIKPVKINTGIESVPVPGSHWWHIVRTLGENEMAGGTMRNILGTLGIEPHSPDQSAGVMPNTMLINILC